MVAGSARSADQRRAVAAQLVTERADPPNTTRSSAAFACSGSGAKTLKNFPRQGFPSGIVSPHEKSKTQLRSGHYLLAITTRYAF